MRSAGSHPWKTCWRGRFSLARVVAILSTFCLALLLIAGVAFVRFGVSGAGLGGGWFRKTLDAPAVVKEVRQMNQLVTVRYSVQKVVGLTEARPPLGSEQILLLVEARVLAGVDLSELTQYDVTMAGGDEVRIRLKPARIAETFIEEKNTKVWDRRITWWTPWVQADAGLEHRARLEALAEVEKAAVEMGILRDAQRNAESDVRAILGAFGITKVTFVAGSS